jgi:hypothetical protein
MLDWINRLGWSRTLSLLIAIIYLLIGVSVTDSPRDVLIVLLVIPAVLLIPLVCIWFGDEVGGYIGALPGPAVTKQSPGWLVTLFGWVLLLLPAILGLVQIGSGKKLN